MQGLAQKGTEGDRRIGLTLGNRTNMIYGFFDLFVVISSIVSLAQFKSDVGKIYAMGGFPRDAMRK